MSSGKFEIDIDGDTAPVGVINDLSDLIDVLGGSSLKLSGAMPFRPLAEQIQHLCTGTFYPVDGVSAIDKSEHLNPVEQSKLTGTAADAAHRLKFAAGYPA